MKQSKIPVASWHLSAKRNDSEFCSELNLHYNIYIYIYLYRVCAQCYFPLRDTSKNVQLKSETLEVRSQFKPFSGSGNTQLFQMGP